MWTDPGLNPSHRPKHEGLSPVPEVGKHVMKYSACSTGTHTFSTKAVICISVLFSVLPNISENLYH